MHRDGLLFAFYWKLETTQFQYCLQLQNEIQIFLFYSVFIILLLILLCDVY